MRPAPGHHLPPSTHSEPMGVSRRSSRPLATISAHCDARGTQCQMPLREWGNSGLNLSKAGWVSRHISEISCGPAGPTECRLPFQCPTAQFHSEVVVQTGPEWVSDIVLVPAGRSGSCTDHPIISTDDPDPLPNRSTSKRGCNNPSVATSI